MSIRGSCLAVGASRWSAAPTRIGPLPIAAITPARASAPVAPRNFLGERMGADASVWSDRSGRVGPSGPAGRGSGVVSCARGAPGRPARCAPGRPGRCAPRSRALGHGRSSSPDRWRSGRPTPGLSDSAGRLGYADPRRTDDRSGRGGLTRRRRVAGRRRVPGRGEPRRAAPGCRAVADVGGPQSCQMPTGRALGQLLPALGARVVHGHAANGRERA